MVLFDKLKRTLGACLFLITLKFIHVCLRSYVREFWLNVIKHFRRRSAVSLSKTMSSGNLRWPKYSPFIIIFVFSQVIHSDILSRQAVNSLIGAVYRCLSLFVSGIDRSAFEVFPCPYIPYVCYLDVLWRFLLFPVFIAFTLLWCVLSQTLSYSLWMHLDVVAYSAVFSITWLTTWM